MGTPRSTKGFTLVEMLVVLAIIGLVAAMSLPLILPMMRRKSIDQATEQVKSTLIFARSRAIQTQRMVNVTFLARERAIVVTDYDVLRGSARPPFCAHFLDNYGLPADSVDVKAGLRFDSLKSAAVPAGTAPVEYLPEGCNFDLRIGDAGYNLTNDPDRLAMTYIFFPGGAVWTLKPGDSNSENNWTKTTLVGSNDRPAGPIIIGPQRRSPSDISIIQVMVYAMTGQVSSEQLQ